MMKKKMIPTTGQSWLRQEKKSALMKKVFSGLLFSASFLAANAQQQYPGYRSGNYTGVNGVFFNPASIADSRYRWDINLFGINAGIGNNNAKFKLKTIGDAIGSNADSLLFGNSTSNLKALANMDILGPSVMFNTGKNTSFAITTRARTLANITDIDGSIINSINKFANDNVYPFSINSTANQSVAVNGWAEIGASIAKVLYKKGNHFLKGGLTAKYLAGYANSYININNISGTVNKDGSGNDYLSNTTGVVALGTNTGIGTDDAQDFKFKFNGSGIGADLGFVYEYRPGGEEAYARNRNNYKFKVGLAVLDLGEIRYKHDPAYTSAYAVNVTGSNRFYLSELDGKTSAELKQYMDTSSFFTTLGSSSGSYNVMLPTTFQANVDWNIGKGFYVDLAGQVAIHNSSKYNDPYYQNNITLTPRYEGKAFGAYVPLNYNALTGFNAGLSLRAGPLYIGSGSILTALLSNSKQADFHVGLRFGILHKKEKERAVKPNEPEVVEVPVQPRDTDGDGVTDENDRCPTVAGVAKYNGCPVPDTDGDGINDEEDKCPAVAGIAKYNGCPVPDTDGDGINDENDKCPTVAGVAKYNGCPVPDTDGDGVNDENDKCPNLAGTAANNGCPEVKAEIEKKVNYAAKSILFQTGKAVLLKSSYKQLDAVAAVLKADKDLKVNIEGHTDKTGKADKNLVLSQNRANAVKTYLVKKGVAPETLTAVGFGDTKPVADNKTAAGRTKNRRVELKLSY